MNARKKRKFRSTLALAASKGKGASGAAANALAQRVHALEEAVETLSWRAFYDTYPESGQVREFALNGQERYVTATADGWVVMMLRGTRTSVASGTRVMLNSSLGGRDRGVVQEGALSGQAFDVASGYLAASYPRIDNLVIRVGKRAGGAVVIGGKAYDLELRLAYSEGGAAKTAGPFAAMTKPANPTPAGDHALELPDFPHDLGAGYGPHGTVWFRIGHGGDRYMHAGRVSEGCITCAPDHWEAIYQIAHRARANDGRSVGTLKVL